MSLEGLMKCAECGLMYEVGRRDWESTEFEVDLEGQVKVSDGERRGRSQYMAHRVASG